MTTLDEFVDRCWDDHASDPVGVAARMGDVLSLVRDPGGAVMVSMLVHHVFGEHLGRWEQGIGMLERLAALAAGGESEAIAIGRCRSSLRLCAGLGDDRAGMMSGDACRVTAMAACALGQFDSVRSSRYMEEAATAADRLPRDDPAIRVVASFANNLAGSLQEKKDPSESEQRLMLRSAELARKYWELAGTWKEVERAEYRLAVCSVAAGNGGRALEHANQCTEIVRNNGSEPLEVFFAAEARALASRMVGNDDLFEQALDEAESSYGRIDQADQPWCLPTLAKLRTLRRVKESGGGH